MEMTNEYEMKKKRSMRNLLWGAVSMGMYMVADWFLDILGPGNEEVGMVVNSNWEKMSIWRFAASGIIAMVAICLTYLGAKELIQIAKSVQKDSTKTGKVMNFFYRFGVELLITIAMGFHMVLCLNPMFYKLIGEKSGDFVMAGEIVNQVDSYIIIPLMLAYVFMDLGSSIAWFYLVLKKKLNLKWFAIICCPLSTILIDFLLKLVPIQVVKDATVAFESLGWLLMFVAAYLHLKRSKE